MDNLANFAESLDRGLETKQNQVAKNKKKLFSIMWQVLVGLFALTQLFPLIWMINYSLTTSAALYGKSVLTWPAPFNLINYHNAWVFGKIILYGLNSIIVVSISLVLSLVFTMLLSYAFTRMRWKLRGICMGLTLLGLMIPIHVTLLPNFLSFGMIGIRDSYLGLIIPYVAFNLPFGVFMMTSFIDSIPASMEEAAVIDGCNVWRLIFQIVTPLTSPALITVAIIDFLNCWKEFIMAAIYISKEELKTLPFSIYNFQGNYMSDYSVQFAVLTIVAMPPIIIYLLLSKRLTKGIMLGAVKE
jgi:raffinose/stachyose/melibiose transport system permease protein